MRVIGACVLAALLGCAGENPRTNDKAKNGKHNASERIVIEDLPESKTVLNGQEEKLTGVVKGAPGKKEEIHLEARVEPADKGVTAEVQPKTLSAEHNKQIEVTVSVGEAAPSGDYKVKITGRSAGAEGSQEVLVQVPKKE